MLREKLLVTCNNQIFIKYLTIIDYHLTHKEIQIKLKCAQFLLLHNLSVVPKI